MKEDFRNCKECNKNFHVTQSDTYDEDFCCKWCAKEWHDKNIGKPVSSVKP